MILAVENGNLPETFDFGKFLDLAKETAYFEVDRCKYMMDNMFEGAYEL